MKIKASNHCEHCGKTDYIEHFFFHCGKLAGFWKLVAHSVQRITGIDMNIDEKMALFGLLYQNERKEVTKKT